MRVLSARELVCRGMCVRVRARLEQRARALHPTWSSRRARRQPAPVGDRFDPIGAARTRRNAKPAKITWFGVLPYASSFVQ